MHSPKGFSIHRCCYPREQNHFQISKNHIYDLHIVAFKKSTTGFCHMHDFHIVALQRPPRKMQPHTLVHLEESSFVMLQSTAEF